MIYIKYTNRNYPSSWSIWAHKRGSKEETRVLSSYGDTYPRHDSLNLKIDRGTHIIKYLTKEEVDLLKLELL